MEETLYQKVKKFKRKYPMTIAWRLKAHSKVIEKHLDKGEKVIYAFAAQKSQSAFDIITTYVLAFTSKRMIIGQKRLLFGYMFQSITADMFNDFSVRMGLIWGNIEIDTVKETVYFSKIQKSALDEIETAATDYLIKEKKKYGINYLRNVSKKVS